MVRPRESREKRICLACGSSTRVSHLGVDLCRACAVFHRRAVTRKYVCRSRTELCSMERGCRKCRFAKIEELLGVSRRCDNLSAPKGTPLLSKVGECYRLMCDIRLIAELSARSPPPHPLEMNEHDFIPIPATFATRNNANAIFLAAILKFGVQAFPEFGELDKSEQWRIATKFFQRFRLFEAGFRADIKFPEDMDIQFGSYTTYISVKVAESFHTDVKANRLMAEGLQRDTRPIRERFRRLKLQDEEVIAVLVLMFWKTDEHEFAEHVVRGDAKYREAVLRELHEFYKKTNLSDYASRLGEVLMFLDIYSQLSTELNLKFELLRMTNVYTDETVVYNAPN